MKMKSMKTVALLAAALVCAVALQADAQYGRTKEGPDKSPGASVTQVIGVDSKVTITYHRPAVKDRKILGDVVAYDEMWRAGANETTAITFSDDVTLNGKSLSAGTLIINKNYESWGSYGYDKEGEVLQVEVDVASASNQERLLYGFEELTPVDGATGTTAFLRWEKKKVSFRIELDD